MAQRSPAEIRSSIEGNRMELAVSLERHRGELLVGAAVVGLAIGGRLLRRRRQG